MLSFWPGITTVFWLIKLQLCAHFHMLNYYMNAQYIRKILNTYYKRVYLMIKWDILFCISFQQVKAFNFSVTEQQIECRAPLSFTRTPFARLSLFQPPMTRMRCWILGGRVANIKERKRRGLSLCICENVFPKGYKVISHTYHLTFYIE